MCKGRAAAFLVVILLGAQGGLLGYSSTQHSPTILEPAQLAAGISNWQFRQFDLFRVNPPLVRMIAALPVLAVGCETDWRGFYFDNAPGSRPEFAIGRDFIAANGRRSVWLFTLARWACIPITILGGMFCFLWATELFGHTGCGLVALTLWCFEPNILGHGELIATDAAATTFGIGAAYTFWHWLKQPNWGRASVAGLLLGLAQLAKMSWLFLFVLWPLLWLFWRLTAPSRNAGHSRSEWTPYPIVGQLVVILFLGLYVLNLGYAFDGTCTRLKEFTFVSRSLTGGRVAGVPGNRFAASWLGALPVPLPKEYLLGLDAQKRDFEDYRGEPSYLRGKWKRGGWWYYYLYGLAVKTPHGLQALVGLALVGALWHLVRGGAKPERWRDAAVLWVPPLQLIAIVSAQLEFNHYMRYVLPVIGFATVAAGSVWPAGPMLLSRHIWAVAVPLAWSVYALVSNYPHQLAYFNEGAGGPRNGYRHLLHDSVDYGQDLYLAERLRASLGERDDAHILFFGGYLASDLGVEIGAPVGWPLTPGAYIISPTLIVGHRQRHALGGPDPDPRVLEELARHPFRRVAGCAMLVVTARHSEGGERP